MSGARRNVKVVVVGGGPTGLMTALCLARRGIESMVVERRQEPTDELESRAITWMPRALEVAAATAVSRHLIDAGIKRTRHRFVTGNRRNLAVADFGALPSEFPYTLQLAQGHSERLLEEAVIETGRVEVLRGVTATSVRHADEGVEVELDRGGSRETVSASWGVGADGARSLTRHLLQVPADMVDYGAHSVVADFVGAVGIPTTESMLVLDARRPHGLFPIAKDRWRAVYRVNPDEAPEHAGSADFAAETIASLLPEAKPRRITWSSAFRLAQSNARSYRSSRWLLVGDAAHPMGPSAGAGMMLGILGAWRLAWALSGPDAETRLLAYTGDQAAAARRVQSANARIFRQIALNSPALGAIRTAALGAVTRIAPIERRMAREESLLNEPLPELPQH